METRLTEAQDFIKQLQGENTELRKRLWQSRAVADVLSKVALRCNDAFQEVMCAVEKGQRNIIQCPLAFEDQSL